MNAQQRLFLVQARSDFYVFQILRDEWRKATIPACHALHYLQMATEKLGRARAWRHGIAITSHAGFRAFLNDLQSNRDTQNSLGYAKQNESWTHLIRKFGPLALSIESLAPAISRDIPNPEYPWPRDTPTACPAEYDFPIWEELQATSHGRQFIKLLVNLFATAEHYLT